MNGNWTGPKSVVLYGRANVTPNGMISLHIDYGGSTATASAIATSSVALPSGYYNTTDDLFAPVLVVRDTAQFYGTFRIDHTSGIMYVWAGTTDTDTFTNGQFFAFGVNVCYSIR